MKPVQSCPSGAHPGPRLSGVFIAALSLCALAPLAAGAAGLALEKEQLKLGFIKLTDMAPLAIAYELGFFEDEGLYVTVEPQANWKVLLDRVITGELVFQKQGKR